MVFAVTAPDLFKAGLPVIPLRERNKMPAINQWQQFAERMPTPEEQKAWMKSFARGNIGLALGPTSGLVAIDIDTTNEQIVRLIEEILPPSPWRRVGKKGAVLLYKFNGQRTFRIKDVNGNSILELLSAGTQIAIPPSIHPDTQMPYEQSMPLADALPNIIHLPEDVELVLRNMLKAEGIELSQSGYSKVSEFIPAGARDNQMTSHAGILARAVTRGERSLVEALSEMEHWILNFTEQVCGDSADPDKAKRKVVEFLTRDVLGDKRYALPNGWDDGLSAEDRKNLGLTFDEEHEDWTYEQYKDYLQKTLTEHTRRSVQWDAAVNHVIERVARSNSLNAMEEGRISKFIQGTTPDLTMPAIKQRIRELRSGPIEGTDHTEIANAALKDLKQFGDIKFNGSEFWQWKGANWEIIDRNEIMKHIAMEYGSMQAAKRQSDHGGIVRIMQSLSVGDLKTSDRNGINFANGFLTTEGKLLEHDHMYGATYTLPYRYMPEMSGKAYKFMQMLHGSWKEDEDCEQKIEALREAIAMTLFGLGPRFSRAIFLFGVPNSGKSQVRDIIKGLVPDSSFSAVSPFEWSDKFMPAHMHNKILNICGELPNDKYVDGERFKTIVSGEEINGQYKGRDAFKFNPTCTHWFATNYLPKTRDTSDGFNRRLLILPFNRPVPLEERVLGIGDEIVAEEREAIVAWAVESLPRLMERKDILLPPSHQEMLDEVANMNNSVRFFLKSSGVVRLDLNQQTHPTKETLLHKEYYNFCVGTAGVKPVGLKPFRSLMRELQSSLGFKMQTKTDKMVGEFVEYAGITLAKREAS